ncbi:MAG: hypothetical protein KC729_22400, partial [Candidatus Eisenbacteria bacterium]|nr:hypothetical protein [Candidatus Eisenbacteria bacterium]
AGACLVVGSPGEGEFGASAGAVYSTDLTGGCAPPAPAEPAFVRGDCNADGGVNIADPVRLLDHLFAGAGIDCDDACDSNDDGTLNIADVIFTLGYVVSSGPMPPAPFPTCGVDPTVDALDCLSFPPCP